MKARTEEVLYHLMAFLDLLGRPKAYKLDESLERWAYRNGFGREFEELQLRKFIEANPSEAGPGCYPPLDRVVRLTDEGRIQAIGGRDPERCWNRGWDGAWRFVIFDLPSDAGALRIRLWRYLVSHHYGHLQFSVWLTPDPAVEISRAIAKLPQASGSFVCVEGKPVAGESDTDLVRTAWSFGEINDRYRHYLTVLGQPIPDSGDQLKAWIDREREAWIDAIELDPLLPRQLNPPGYLGYQAWNRRKRTFSRRG